MEKTMGLNSVGKCDRENNVGDIRSNQLIGASKEFLYLRWNEHHLRAYFETLMSLLQSKRFLLQGA